MWFRVSFREWGLVDDAGGGLSWRFLSILILVVGGFLPVAPHGDGGVLLLGELFLGRPGIL